MKLCSGAKSFFMVMGSVSWWLASLSLVLHLIWCNNGQRSNMSLGVTIHHGQIFNVITIVLILSLHLLTITTRLHPLNTCTPPSSPSPSPSPPGSTPSPTAPSPHPQERRMVQCEAGGVWATGGCEEGKLERLHTKATTTASSPCQNNTHIVNCTQHTKISLHHLHHHHHHHYHHGLSITIENNIKTTFCTKCEKNIAGETLLQSTI